MQFGHWTLVSVRPVKVEHQPWDSVRIMRTPNAVAWGYPLKERVGAEPRCYIPVCIPVPNARFA
jgi:hypothetical protein